MNDPSEPPRKRSRRSTSDESAELQALRAALAAKDDELKVLATENAALRESQSLSQPVSPSAAALPASSKSSRRSLSPHSCSAHARSAQAHGILVQIGRTTDENDRALSQLIALRARVDSQKRICAEAIDKHHSTVLAELRRAAESARAEQLLHLEMSAQRMHRAIESEAGPLERMCRELDALVGVAQTALAAPAIDPFADELDRCTALASASNAPLLHAVNSLERTLRLGVDGTRWAKAGRASSSVLRRDMCLLSVDGVRSPMAELLRDAPNGVLENILMFCAPRDADDVDGRYVWARLLVTLELPLRGRLVAGPCGREVPRTFVAACAFWWSSQNLTTEERRDVEATAQLRKAADAYAPTLDRSSAEQLPSPLTVAALELEFASGALDARTHSYLRGLALTAAAEAAAAAAAASTAATTRASSSAAAGRSDGEGSSSVGGQHQHWQGTATVAMLRVAVGADRCDEFDTSGIEVGGSGSGSPEDIVIHSRRAIAAWIANGLEGYVKRGELHLGAATALKLRLPRCPWIAAVAHGRRFLQNSSILSSKRPLDRASLLKWSTRAELDLVPASEVETWKRRRIVDDARLRTTLLYRASEDGWEADDFHCHCDRQGPTMTIIRTTGNCF